MSAEVPPKKEPLPALVRRRADGVEMEDVADPTYGMKPLCERGAKLWNGIDTKMYEMQPLEDGDPSGNFPYILFIAMIFVENVWIWI